MRIPDGIARGVTPDTTSHAGGAEFLHRSSLMPIGCRKALKVGNRFEVPNDDAGTRVKLDQTLVKPTFKSASRSFLGPRNAERLRPELLRITAWAVKSGR